MSDRDIRSAPSIFLDALRHLSALLQNELTLAKAELRENISRAGTGIAFLVIAALLALVALNVLASALVAWIAASGLSVGLSALIVGGAVLTVAGILAIAGRTRLSPDALTPDRTVANVKRDVATLKEATHA